MPEPKAADPRHRHDGEDRQHPKGASHGKAVTTSLLSTEPFSP